jgi:hypothetical protein
MVKWLINDELRRIWKEAVMGWSRYNPEAFLKGLRGNKTTC